MDVGKNGGRTLGDVESIENLYIGLNRSFNCPTFVTNTEKNPYCHVEGGETEPENPSFE